MKPLRLNSIVQPISKPSRVDLSREVFGVLGIPIDTVGLPECLRRLNAAVENRQPFLLSTPNVNFLIASRTDAAFRESLLASDLCTIDGMPVVWISRLLGIKVEDRVSGADIFSALKYGRAAGRRRSIFLFGGADETAVNVGKSLDADSIGLQCAGAFNPGFGTIEELSRPSIIDRVNRAQADILAVFMTAKKAQSWLIRNHDQLTAPIRAQFGATINFEAGTVTRAPAVLRRTGFEWLWRIKEEPTLWRRYWADGCRLLQIVSMSAVPLAALRYLQNARTNRSAFAATVIEDTFGLRLCLSGFATERNVTQAIESFEQILEKGRPFVVDLAELRYIDPRFFGLLLMVRKELGKRGRTLEITRASRTMRMLFRLNGFDFLLQCEQ